MAERTPLTYIHLRVAGSTAACGLAGQHTTKKASRVTCWKCQNVAKNKEVAI